jgi:NitT/TauT family transport system permease protein
MENGCISTDKNKILLLKSLGASKFQTLTKLVIPSSIPTLVSCLKINVGMSWIGSIMGEYLVSKQGIGYLIVYGGQVFRLDLVMASTALLCLLASLMYGLVVLLEKLIIKRK